MIDSARIKLLTYGSVGMVSLVVLLYLAGLGKAQSDVNEAHRETVRVKNISVENQYAFSQRILARVEATNETALAFDLNGIVNVISVDEGDQVVKGQLLAELDTDRLQAQVDELRTALDRAKADQKLASLTRDRIASLVEKKLESSQRLDEVDAQLDVARAATAQVQAQLRRVQVDIDRSKLMSPFNAEVIARQVDTGATVMNGQAIFTLQSAGVQELRASLPARLAKSLNVGDTVQFADSGLNTTLTRFVNSQNTSTRTQDAIFVVNDKDWRGVNGEIIGLIVPVEREQVGAWIPLSALSSGIRGMWTVFVVEPNESKLESRIVEVVHTNGEKAYVNGAIENGEKLVMDGTHRLVPGQQVAVLGE